MCTHVVSADNLHHSLSGLDPHLRDISLNIRLFDLMRLSFVGVYVSRGHILNYLRTHSLNNRTQCQRTKTESPALDIRCIPGTREYQSPGFAGTRPAWNLQNIKIAAATAT